MFNECQKCLQNAISERLHRKHRQVTTADVAVAVCWLLLQVFQMLLLLACTAAAGSTRTVFA